MKINCRIIQDTSIYKCDSSAREPKKWDFSQSIYFNSIIQVAQNTIRYISVKWQKVNYCADGKKK